MTITENMNFILQDGVYLTDKLMNTKIIYFDTIRYNYQLIVNEIFAFRIADIEYVEYDNRVLKFLHNEILYCART